MKPLTISYSDSMPTKSAERTTVLNRQSLHMPVGYLFELETSINRGDIDNIVIVGRNMCTGWILSTTRTVKFILPKGLTPEEVAQLSTRVRPDLLGAKA